MLYYYVRVYSVRVVIFSAGTASSSCVAGTTTTNGERERPDEGRVYLNVNETATCNGTVTGWHYCFHPDDDLETTIDNCNVSTSAERHI